MFLLGAFTFPTILDGALSFDVWLPWDEVVCLGAIKTYSSPIMRGLEIEGILKGFGIK